MGMAARGIKPVDHAKENRMALKQAQQNNRLRKMDETAAANKNFTLQKFKNVESRVLKQADSARPSSAERRAFLQKGQGAERRRRPSESRKPKWVPGALPETNNEPDVEAQASQWRNRSENAKPRVPNRDIARQRSEQAPQREQQNFIEKNAVKARQSRMKTQFRPNRQAEIQETSAHRNGKVPDYINRRKQELAEEKRRQRARDDDCPEGMMLMPEADRLDTLNTLKASKKEGETQLMKMPLHVNTIAQKQHIQKLEAQLKEIESAIQIFKKPKVFIAE